MLEILVVWAIASQFRKMAMAKGLSPAHGAWALLWFAGEILGAVVAVVLDLGDAVYVTALLGALLGAGAAFLVVRSLPAAPGWVPGMRWAGFCKKCGTNVWVQPNGKCEHGHAASAVRKLYVPPQQTPQPPGIV